MKKLLLYANTILHTKPSQLYYRLGKILKRPCALGAASAVRGSDGAVCLMPELDFDPVFLARFPAEELMENKVTFLHEAEEFDWNRKWDFPDRSPLWNYNLHYFEYLFPLVKAWHDTGEPAYPAKIKEMIRGWIAQNPQSAGCGWAPYTISLRLVNWLSCYGYLSDVLDEPFRREMLESMGAQYLYLSRHLEKDLLGNHYFENLKALILCGVFFRDESTVRAALKEFRAQCAEQILPDGMHFELSPMYHKIILEDLLRVCAALGPAEKRDAELETYLQPMLDAAYSLEEGLNRVPLFNDGGDNVAKSLNALINAARIHFSLTPKFRGRLEHSGYYIFRWEDYKLILDAGQPGPSYIPGHAHCDAMSFELFHRGQPLLVNCGTYAYQCGDRLFYKNTSAHNTVMRKGIEQSQCWGSFRLAKGARVSVLEAEDASVLMEMRDQKKGVIQRRITVGAKEILIQDRCPGEVLQAFIHCNTPIRERGANHWETDSGVSLLFPSRQTVSFTQMPYAPNYGQAEYIPTLITEARDTLECRIPLP